MRKIKLLWFVCTLFSFLFITEFTWAAFDSASLNKQKPLEISRVTPKGKDVPAGRQIVFQFNQPVVPLGKMERESSEIPILITPTLNCEWHWLNTSALACELTDANKLKLATHYHVTVHPGIKTESGQTLARPITHEFITKRPAVGYASFEFWRAPGVPEIRISFNQDVTRNSVEKHVFMEKSNRARIGLQVTTTEKLKPGQAEPDTARRWKITPLKPLPLNTSIKLITEPGLESAAGTEKGVKFSTVLSFDTFPQFKFLGIQCTNLSENEVIIEPKDRPNYNNRCDPQRQIALRFSSPVISDTLKNSLQMVPDLADGRKDYDPWANAYNYNQLDQIHRKSQVYRVWLPELLKAYHTYKVRANKIKLKDEFGRPLSASVNMRFATDHRKPSHGFDHRHSVLEKGIDSEVPFYVTNIDEILFDYHTLTPEGWSPVQSQFHKLTKVQDVAYKIPLGIRQLLPEDSGVIQGHFYTTPNTLDRYYPDNWFFSQVTPFHVHAKVGHHNTLVWITDFAKGQPVVGVQINLQEDTFGADSKAPEVLATATTDANGIAILPGTAKLDPKLKTLNSYKEDGKYFFIHCQKEKDSALLPLNSEYRVYEYGNGNDYASYPHMRHQYGHMRTWGTTAQGVYKAGDTIQYKILVRDQGNDAFIPPPNKNYHLKIVDPMGKVVHERKDIELSEFGGLDGEYAVPKKAAVGWYEFKLTADFANHESYQWWRPMKVLVSDFTPSPFRVRTHLSGDLFQLGGKVNVETNATMHAGGPYANANTRVTATLSQSTLTSNHPEAKGFQFDVHLDDYYDTTVFDDDKHSVSDKGLLNTEFTLTESPVLYGKLRIESAVRDDRGKFVANTATARYVGRDRFVGLKETQWVLQATKPAQIKMVVIDPQGTPITDTNIKVKIERQETKAAKVKGAGNAYLTKYEHTWVDTKQTCAAKSTASANICEFTPEKAGTYRLTAMIKDTQGREHKTILRQWATGSHRLVWETSPGNGLEVIPEQNSYKVGDTARYLVKNPYPGAQALVTVERFGVLKSWITTLKDSVSIVEVPVEADFTPGFYVSVMVVSPRVEKPIDANQVDLGKPAFRMGYVKTAVNDPYKSLVVDIQTDKTEYRPGDKVTLDLQAKPKQSDVDAKPIELAIAVLDESVFDLLQQGRDYFDPYKGFYNLDDLDMANFSLLMRLVGRHKFEKKGANTGGDGSVGGPTMRSLFKFVSYWNPSIKTDKEGKAQVSFELPDNLTGWRVLAMAVTATDRMGLSDTNFKVNQPIELRPVLPNQLTSGDQFVAGFNVMNRTDQDKEITVTIEAAGPVTDPQEEGPMLPAPLVSEQTVTIAARQRQTVWLPLATTGGGDIKFTATATDGVEQDGLQKTLQVRKRRALETAATYGTTTQAEITESLKFPEDIYPDTGGLTVIASPTVIGGVEGAFEFMRDYPYFCWEQKLTKGVMASHYNNLQNYLPESLVWPESKTLTQKTLGLATEYQAPNGGMAFWVAKNERVNPYLSAYTALAFNWLRASGHNVPAEVEKNLHKYLLTLLRKDVMPSFYSKGMSSTVRAVALAALAKQGKTTHNDIQRYESHVPNMDLFGKAEFLAAAVQTPGTKLISKEVANDILSHANQTSGKITFSEDLDDGYQRLLSSALRTQCAILSSLVLYDEKQNDGLVSDLPFKLVRSITQTRKQRGHWENTQENMFCMNALTDYARVYEKDMPNMTVTSFLNETQLGQTKFEALTNPPVSFEHAMATEDVGSQSTVKLIKAGIGRFYYTLRMRYATKAEKATAINSGIEVKREYHVERESKWILLDNKMELKTGELVRVDLYLSLPAPRHYVVVNDPVPGGLEPVNRDLATASKVDADKAKGDYAGASLWFSNRDWHEYAMTFWSFYHKELRHHAAMFFSDYLPAGNYHLSYVSQAIASGEFAVMATHAEEMYNPEVYGKGVPASLKVTQ